MNFYRCMSGGGSQQKIAIGSTTVSTSSTTTVTLGFRPKYLCAWKTNSSLATNIMSVYDERLGTNKIFLAGTGTYLTKETMPLSGQNRVGQITDTGFIYNKSSSSSYLVLYYFAIG